MLWYRTLQVLLFSLFVSLNANAETIRLTSLVWPPYSGPDLPGQGASIVIAKAAFQAMGHDLEVDFFPWSRAVRTALSDDSYIGYFPEYQYQTDVFTFSDTIGSGPLGFIENVQNPIQWQTIEDLTAFRLGVVQDYVNTPELDALIASGDIKTEAVTSDSRNILMVAYGRVDLAVIDPNVLYYQIHHDDELISARSRVQMNDKLLVNKELFIAFTNTPEAVYWTQIFNEGLTQVDVDAIMREHGIVNPFLQ